jgi:hypothetical protein
MDQRARKVHLIYGPEARKLHILYGPDPRKVHILYGTEARKVHIHYRTEWPENTSKGEGQQLRLFMVISNAGKRPRLPGTSPH